MSERTVKCLSVQQPWAALILGHTPDLNLPFPKNVENRTWPTKHRGPLLIHAGLRPDREAFATPGLGSPADPCYQFGVILGVVNVTGCVHDDALFWAAEGQWHWLLDSPRRFESPVPWCGRLGIFDVPVSALGGQLLGKVSA